MSLASAPPAPRPFWLKCVAAIGLALFGATAGLVAGSAGAMWWVVRQEPNFPIADHYYHVETLFDAVRMSGGPLSFACLVLGAWLVSRI